MSKAFAPPRRDRVEHRASIREAQTATAGADHLERWKILIVTHLPAGMPEHVEIAGSERHGTEAT